MMATYSYGNKTNSMIVVNEDDGRTCCIPVDETLNDYRALRDRLTAEGAAILPYVNPRAVAG